jgi:small-conductance mechanosensitive channel
LFQIFGVKLVGITAANGRKLLLTLMFIALAYGFSRLLQAASGLVFKEGRRNRRIDFWTRQVISLVTAVLIILGVVSIWFDNPARLTSAMGFLTAGLAIALQKVITAVAAYLIILRGKTFNVGDRIQMAGVRGDVIALGFIQTTVMEMGQSPSEQQDPPGMWVHARQYTGRLVTITNDKIFDEPVYNYSREFPFIWEEMTIPISYKDNRRRAEQIILDKATRHTIRIAELSDEGLTGVDCPLKRRSSFLT